MLLTFNLMANINNNINNNNNNNNDNNINAIDQNSQNTATNTNAANQISVTVLPIPGKRSIEHLKSDPCVYQRDKNNLEDLLASNIFKYIVLINENVNSVSNICNPYKICNILKSMSHGFRLDNIISFDLLKSGENPNVQNVSCQGLFPGCALKSD